MSPTPGVSPPPDEPARPPLLVRYLFGNVRTRSAAVWLVVATVVFVGVAVALQDAFLVAIAVLGVAAYLWSIRWMDTHDGWALTPEPDGATAPDPASLEVAAPPPPDLVDPSSRPGAIESLRSTSFSATAPATAASAGAGSRPASAAARAFGALILVATLAFLGSLAALEAGGDDPTGAHLVEVFLDALFGLGFGALALVVALQRQRLPGPQLLSVIASGGLGLVAGLGYFIAGSVAAANPSGPGTAVAWLIAASASGAGVWLTASSGGRAGLLLSIPAVLIGWYLGAASWLAHINSV